MPLLYKEYTKRAKFTPESFNIFCKNNNLECSFLQKNSKIDRNSRIQGKCFSENCNGTFNTNFRSLIENNTYYCKECLNKISDKKRQETCNQLYGVSHVAKSKEIQLKTASTNQIKYGGKTPANSVEIKNKIKETNNKKSQEEKQSIIKKRNTTKLKIRDIDYFDYSKEALIKLSSDLNITLLDNKGNINDEYYNNINRDDIIHFICINENCNNKYSKTFRCIKESSGAFCEKCSTENMVVKFQTTYESNTGYIHPTKNPKVLEKIKQTNIKRRRVEWSLQDPNVKDKGKQTNLKKYGTEYAVQNKEVQENTKKTCLSKYGVEHPAQNKEVMEKCSKNAYKRKEYKFPSGKIEMIQGFENYALDEILQNTELNESNVIVGSSNVPEIWYEDSDGKKHRHYVDIFIPSQNKMIEVKSTWTAEKKKDNIFLKQEAGKKNGYLYEIWVYNSKGEKVECHK